MEITGYIAAAFIGVSLGLIGGGGSILTLPVLVYLFGITPAAATSYSLFIVGATSLLGAVGSFRRKLVAVPAALLFGLPSIVMVFITRKWVVPAVPDHLFFIGGFAVTKELAVMLLFAGLMLAASFFMLTGKTQEQEEVTAASWSTKVWLPAYGMAVGFLTGLLGAGGGFLIIPALMLLAGLPMKKATGTSLVIMAVSTLIGFYGDPGKQDINWRLLLIVTAIAIGGVLVGGALASRIAGAKLRHAFGWFVLAMGVYIILSETVFK